MKRHDWVTGKEIKRETLDEPPVGSIWRLKKKGSWTFKWHLRVDERRPRSSPQNTCVSRFTHRRKASKDSVIKDIRRRGDVGLGMRRTIKTKELYEKWDNIT